jgi:hypothetical protein
MAILLFGPYLLEWSKTCLYEPSANFELNYFGENMYLIICLQLFYFRSLSKTNLILEMTFLKPKYNSMLIKIEYIYLVQHSHFIYVHDFISVYRYVSETIFLSFRNFKVQSQRNTVGCRTDHDSDLPFAWSHDFKTIFSHKIIC